MEQNKENNVLEELLVESSIPEDARNLRRKIDSICRTIENLSAKKLNLELEIKTQKRVLTRKRNELKKRSKSNQAVIKATLESAGLEEIPREFQILQKVDQTLLRESSRLLES